MTVYLVPALLFVFGLALGLSLRYLRRSRRLRRARLEAETIASEALAQLQEWQEEEKRRSDDQLQEWQEHVDQEVHQRTQRLEALEQRLNEREQQWRERLQARQSLFDKKQSVFSHHAKHVEHKEQNYMRVKEELNQLVSEYTERLLKKGDFDKNEIKTNVQNQLINQVEVEATRFVSEEENKAYSEAERNAKKIINIALSRFARPYCAERGIGYVYLNEKVKERVLGPQRQNLGIVEKLIGVDLIYNEEFNSIGVSGFDPVRRELARASLEKLCNERTVNEERIQAIVSKTKRDLLRKLRQDGQALINDLKLKDVHPEIRNMMGALRYRYSFAQNQYFHCGEVGYLCGLLSSELSLDIFSGRRAGMLHDIGKAMDHSIDGGHAVIGADFIARHGEQKEIVHAVRAHHYDEQPSTDLAFLVIAADAISGARPGARRSTADSYVQKMGQLEEIGNSFKGVLHTYILSAGREVRVYVDSHKVDDLSALELSRQIAHKIEEECNYPGLIKVTVVRETQAVQIAK